MLGLINHLISCLTLPFFILSAISVLGICLLKRKYAVSICVFLFFTTLWRLLFTISSSRNYSFYLICAFVAIAFAAKHVASKKHSHYALITVLFVILFFHFNKLNGSFKNTYIADIRDCTSTFLHDGHTVLFVDAKDFNRIRNTDLFPQKQYGFLEVTLPYHNLLAMYTKYDFRENDACFILSEKAGTHFDAPILSFFRENNIRFQKIQQYRTNTSKTRFYSVYYLEHFKPPSTHIKCRADDLISAIWRAMTLFKKRTGESNNK